MKTGILTIFVLEIIALNMVISLPVNAYAGTIIVPDQYPTITSAIGNATNGDTIFIREGIYEEHSLIIDKSISIVGQDAEGTVVRNIDPEFWDPSQSDFPQLSPVLEVKSDFVEIFNLTIIGNGTGIMGKGSNIKIDGNTIRAPGGLYLNGSNQTIAQNKVCAAVTLINCSYGIIHRNIISEGVSIGNPHILEAFSGQSGSNLVYDNIIEGTVSIQSNKNTVVKNNARGITIINGSFNEIYLNNFTQGKRGIWMANGFNNTIYANSVKSNEVGVIMQEDSSFTFSGIPNKRGQTANNTIYHNNFLNNSLQVERANAVGFIPQTEYDEKQPLVDYLGKTNNHFDNDQEGNYWQDYNAADIDNNKIGDKPYLLGNSIIDRYPLIEPFNTYTVALSLPDWVSITPQLEQQTEPQYDGTAIAMGSSICLTLAILGVIVFKKRRKIFK